MPRTDPQPSPEPFRPVGPNEEGEGLVMMSRRSVPRRARGLPDRCAAGNEARENTTAPM